MSWGCRNWWDHLKDTAGEQARVDALIVLPVLLLLLLFMRCMGA